MVISDSCRVCPLLTAFFIILKMSNLLFLRAQKHIFQFSHHFLFVFLYLTIINHFVFVCYTKWWNGRNISALCLVGKWFECWGFCFLGYDAAWHCNKIPMFGCSIVSLSLRVRMFSDISIPVDKDAVLPWKCNDPVSQWHCAMCQKHGILSCTAVKTLNLTLVLLLVALLLVMVSVVSLIFSCPLYMLILSFHWIYKSLCTIIEAFVQQTDSWVHHIRRRHVP